MQRWMLKAKIHRATLTATELHYEGSIVLDRLLLEAADIVPGEQVHVLNINNGARVITYAIAARAGSGIVSLQGAAARTGQVGDKLIMLTYALVAANEMADLRSRTVYVDNQNRILPSRPVKAAGKLRRKR